MARCESCLFGVLRGTMGNLTFYWERGRQIVKKRRKKGPRLSDILKKEKLSEHDIKQVNANFIFSVLTYMAKEVSSGVIYPVWWREVIRKRLRMSARNLFFKHNFCALYESISADKLCGGDNKPDLSKLVLTVGDLDGARIKNVWYNGDELLVEWEHNRGANLDDYAYIVVIRADFDGIESWGNMEIFGDARTPVGRRGDGRGCIRVKGNQGIRGPGDVYVYLFFSSCKVRRDFPRVPEYSVSESVRINIANFNN